MTAGRIVIEVTGEATGKGRPRATRTGRIYTPAKTVRAEARLAFAAQQAMAGRPPLADAVRVEVEIAVAIPASWSKRRRTEAFDGKVRPTTRPDIDNTIKLICDAFNHVVFHDDRQVLEVVATKHYAPAGAMRITVAPLLEFEEAVTVIDILGQLRGVKRSGPGWAAQCPCPGHKDRNASLSIAHGDKGWVLFCFAGCAFDDIVTALGVKPADLFDDAERRQTSSNHRTTAHPSPRTANGSGSSGDSKGDAGGSGDGLTLAAYAADKKLPVEFLRSLGLFDSTWQGAPAVSIPYRVDGQVIAMRYRISMRGDRFRWPPGSKPVLYAQEQLDRARTAGAITLVEGESDVHCLAYHGVPAIGLPGASSWNEERDALLLDGIATIYVLLEPDKGGEQIRQSVSRSKIRDRVKFVSLLVKDAADLHVQDPDRFVEHWQAALAAAVPWSPDAESDAADEEAEAEALLIELAGLKPFEYAKRRPEAAERLGVTLKVLDAEVRSRWRKAGGDNLAGRPASFLKIEPCADPVDGAEVLTLVSSAIRRHVVVSQTQADTSALWVAHAHCIDAADHTPFLALLSPEPGSGKSTMLKVLRLLTPKARLSTSITAANLFRFVDKYQPTLLIDEADAFVPEKEELRGILDGGHDRDTALVSRLVASGDDYEDREFFTFCAKAIAMMGKRPHPTLVGRSIVIEMQRYAPGERPARIDRAAKGDLASLAGMVARWTIDNVDKLRGADPVVPDLRDGDNWRPLFAIATLAGGGWADKAKAAAVALSGSDVGQDSIRVELLRDIRALFEERDVDRLTSKAIVEALVAKETRPWAEWKTDEWKVGKPLTANQLAGLLKPHKIRPGTIRLSSPPLYEREVDRQTGNNDKETASGYLREQFIEAWKRYLQDDPPPSQPLTSSQPQTSAVSEPFDLSQEKPDVRGQTGGKAAETLNNEDVRPHSTVPGDTKGAPAPPIRKIRI